MGCCPSPGPDAAGSVTSPTAQSAEAAAANGQLSRTTSAAAPCSSELEAEINTALIVGNYAAAVEHCFKAARYADALLIANTAGKALYQQVMRRYLRKAPHPYQVCMMSARTCSSFCLLDNQLKFPVIFRQAQLQAATHPAPPPP